MRCHSRDALRVTGTVIDHDHPRHGRQSGQAAGQFVLPVPDAAAGLDRAAATAKGCGAIASYVYSTDEPFLAAAEEAFIDAGANLTANTVGPMPINFSAAYSDYHVTGINPAGTATLTDEAFVAGRFRIVQTRRQV